MIEWNAIDTVLLDMDGTLLDLCYDNTLWSALLPERYGALRQLDADTAAAHLFTHMQERRGQLEFYCLDYWAEFTGLDVVALHHELTALIRYRPGAAEFLDGLRTSERRSVLVTNAHRDSLAVKDRHAGLVERLDAAVSCHDYGAPKESQDFWHALMAEHPFDPARTLLIDDNASVLDAAAEYGVAHLLTVAQPDSARPTRDDLSYPAVDHFDELAATLAPTGTAGEADGQ